MILEYMQSDFVDDSLSRVISCNQLPGSTPNQKKNLCYYVDYRVGDGLTLYVLNMNNQVPWDPNPQSTILCWKNISVSFDDKGAAKMYTRFSRECDNLEIDYKEDIFFTPNSWTVRTVLSTMIDDSWEDYDE